MKNMKQKVFSILLSLATAFCCYGQNTAGVSFYSIDSKQAGDIAGKIAAEYSPEDKVNQANYKAAMVEAFEKYSRCGLVTLSWRNDTLKVLDGEIKKLKQDLTTNKEAKKRLETDTLKFWNNLLIKVRQETAELKNAISEKDSADFAAKGAFDKIMSNLAERKAQMEQQLAALKKEYLEVCSETSRLEGRKKMLESENEKINYAASKVSDQRKENADLLSRLESAVRQLRTASLMNIDGKDYLPLTDEYAEKTGQVKLLSPEMENSMEKSVTLIKDYVSLSAELKGALDQMGKKLNAKANQQYAEELRGLKEKLRGSLSAGQANGLDQICRDLEGQEKAYQHFSDMLTALQEEYVCIFSDNERQRISDDGFFRKQAEYYGTSKTPPYSGYYTLLNTAFEKLQKDLAVGSKSLLNESVNTEEKFKQYLNKIKSNL